MNWLNDIVFLNAVQYFATIALGASMVWLLARLSPSTMRRLKDAWKIFRVYVPDVIRAIDQPDDSLVRALALLGVPPDQMARLGPRVLRAIFDAMDEALETNTPRVADYRAARGVLSGIAEGTPAEDLIREIRDAP